MFYTQYYFVVKVYLPGSGAATSLLKVSSQAGLEMVILSKFCEEGDNTREEPLGFFFP